MIEPSGDVCAIFFRMPAKITWILLAIILAASFLRLGDLSAPSLWDDEMHTIEFSSRPVSAMWKQSAQKDSNPLGFYLLLHAWLPFGDGEFFFRLPSVLFGVAAVLVIFFLTAALYGRPTGLIAAALLALHPLAIYCSQEVRAHALAFLLITVAIAALIRLLNHGNKIDAVIYWISMSLALHCHYYAFFILGGHLPVLLWLLWRDSRRARQDAPQAVKIAAMSAAQQSASARVFGSMLAGGAMAAHQARLRGITLAFLAWTGAILAFLPFFKVFAFQLLRGQAWRPTINLPTALAKMMVYFCCGATPDRLPTFGLVPGDGAGAGLLLVILVLACLPLAIAVLIGLADDQPEPRSLSAALFLAPLILFAVTLAISPVFDVRHAVLFLPLLLALAARGVTRLGEKSRWLGAGLFCVIIAPMTLSLWQAKTDPAYARQAWRGAGASVCRQQQAGDIALVYHAEKGYAFRYYTRACKLPVHDVFDDRVFTMDLEKRRAAVRERLGELTTTAKRIWLVDYHGAVYDPADEVRGVLKKAGFFYLRRATYDRGVKQFHLDLFSKEKQQAEKAFSSIIDFGAPYNPGQLLAGWYPPGEKGAWTAQTGSVLLRREGQEQIAATCYIHRPFYSGPVTVRLLVEGVTVAESVIDDSQTIVLSGEAPGDIGQMGLVNISVRTQPTFIPAEVLDTDDRTVKGVLVQRIEFRNLNAPEN